MVLLQSYLIIFLFLRLGVMSFQSIDPGQLFLVSYLNPSPVLSVLELVWIVMDIPMAGSPSEWQVYLFLSEQHDMIQKTSLIPSIPF